MSNAPRIQIPIERFELDNGLRVVLHRDTSVPLVAVNLWYHVGSKNERPGRTGFAHLFEHMLFQGSQHVGTNDHFRYVQQVGGVANGSTAWDRTNYFETLPSNSLELGLWLESDRLGHFLPALSSETLENQRDVVMNERRQRVDNQPYGSAFERLQEMLFASPHPYSWPIIGYMEDIEAATLEEIEAFFRKYYVPNNAVLTLAGDIEIDQARAAVERYFDEIPRGADIEPVEAELLPLDSERTEVLEDDVELPRVYMSYQAPPLVSDDWRTGDLLATVLSGGKSSPLYRDLAHERRLVQDVRAMILPTEIASTFLVVATAQPGVELERVEAALDEHLTRAAETPIPEVEIERARNRYITAYLDRLQHVEDRAELLSSFTTFYDEPERLCSELNRYLALGAADLSSFARRYLRRDRRVRLQVVPRRGRPS